MASLDRDDIRQSYTLPKTGRQRHVAQSHFGGQADATATFEDASMAATISGHQHYRARLQIPEVKNSSTSKPALEREVAIPIIVLLSTGGNIT